MKTIIELKKLELWLHLGWPKEERETLQRVLVDIQLHFHSPPKGCESDLLQDTVCYHALSDIIKKTLAQERFHLIERLSLRLYEIIQHEIKISASIAIRVFKQPSISHLTEGVSFYYGDKDITWSS